MIEVEVFDLRGAGCEIPPAVEVRRMCALAAGSAGLRDGHLAVEFVDAARITELNRSFRGEPTATDVLSFPVDGVPVDDAGSLPDGARELGDVVICPAHTHDVREAIVHGVLHLAGFDHETDDGEMLALQRRVLASSEQ